MLLLTFAPLSCLAYPLYKSFDKSQQISPLFGKIPTFLLLSAKKGAPQSGAPEEALYAVSILAQVGRGVGIGALAEVEVVAGQNGVEDDAGDGSDSQGGQGDRGAAHLEGQAAKKPAAKKKTTKKAEEAPAEKDAE